MRIGVRTNDAESCREADGGGADLGVEQPVAGRQRAMEPDGAAEVGDVERAARMLDPSPHRNKAQMRSR